MTKENKWAVAVCLSFTVGVVLGGIYCAFFGDSAGMYEYLHNFSESIKSGADNAAVFKKALLYDIKPILLFLLCAFVSFGFVPICAISAMQGFSVGFTFAALFKYFGNNGILLIISQLPAKIIFFIVIVIFGGICSSLSSDKKDKRLIGTVFALFAAAVLCMLLSAVCEGYLDTWLISNIAVKLY